MEADWAARADAAEAAVCERHVRMLWALPHTELGVVAWPAGGREGSFLVWNYWWQAHLLDCVLDAFERSGRADCAVRAKHVVAGHRLRNLTGWTNRYYDDMAWLALALERARRIRAFDKHAALRVLEAQFVDAWQPERGGGIPWRRGSDFFNVPANAPAALVLARTGRVRRAEDMADWMDRELRDDATYLLWDGVHLPEAGTPVVEQVFYTYCQGVALALEVELANRLDSREHRLRVYRMVEAIDRHLTVRGVIQGRGGGDGGLFAGILARYLAFAATKLRGDEPADRYARGTAAALVTTSAEHAWNNRLEVEGLPLFGHEWSEQAQLPMQWEAGRKPERDLSVQLSGWMLMEAAHRVTTRGVP
ncbi:glycoside hydrolase family 76 protein [Rhodococcus sp. HNM0569]|uniref:glycoside hydrolase family 76 protein n=1 Tax=Rhodococcus sp. HNM0569 TaxID=2716340 RepID=UPI00146DB509|nr:glycoside hydrolase family 76 protein [Rhodococcus sp. HNM0569]NLU83226.1 fructose-bisphosphate aldolase [Rhodococcus sp. HNM0569]